MLHKSSLYAWLFLFFVVKATNAVSCKDPEGKDVDWFVAYKIPRATIFSDGTGSEYFYLTSNNFQEWSYEKDITTSSEYSRSILEVTMNQYYQNQDNLQAYFYNDQVLGLASYAHAKGIVVRNKENKFFWIIHSVPNFHPRLNFVYPDTGLKYGQMFICLSLESQNYALLLRILEVIGANFIGDTPFIFSNYTFPNTIYHEEAVTALGANLKFIYKTNDVRHDIYTFMKAEISPDQNLRYQCWKTSNQPPGNGFSRVTVVLLQWYSWGGGDGMKGCDHSKWMISAVAEGNKGGWVCIGDLNRAESQQIRGGGFYCIQNIQLWRLFNEIIYSTVGISKHEDIECACDVGECDPDE